jgi:hypothetical protein
MGWFGLSARNFFSSSTASQALRGLVVLDFAVDLAELDLGADVADEPLGGAFLEAVADLFREIEPSALGQDPRQLGVVAILRLRRQGEEEARHEGGYE